MTSEFNVPMVSSCPFCGYDNPVLVRDVVSNKYYVKCISCGAMGSVVTSGEIAKYLWNSVRKNDNDCGYKSQLIIKMQHKIASLLYEVGRYIAPKHEDDDCAC